MLYTNYFIDSLSERNPSNPILFAGTRTITAEELLQSAYQLAVGLKESGVGKGDKVVIVVKPGIEFLQIIYANMMIGTIVSIIDPEMGRENYLAKLKQFAPNHAFADSRLVLLNEHPVLKFLILKLNKSVPSLPRLKNCRLWTTGIWLPIFQKHKHIPTYTSKSKVNFDFEPINDKDDFLITYTSGTLSEPKGVVHSYYSLSNSIKHLTEMLHTNNDEIIATHLPHYTLLGISAGIKVYLWDNQMSSDAKIEFIRNKNITTLFGPPSDFIPLIHFLNKAKTNLPACIKNIYLGSAPIYTSFLSNLIPVAEHVKITCLYGMTENLMVTYQDGREKLNRDDEGDLVGLPFPNVNINIKEDGEICVHSDQMFSGYWRMPKTNATFHTGDIGKMDNEGRLILLGRKKDIIIKGNFNIYPTLYEPTISKIKGVKEAVLIGIYNSVKADEEIILVIDGVKELTRNHIMKQLVSGKYSIDSQAIPDKIVFMKIPHSGRHNKVNRKLLKNILNN
ncbi:MAG TPA: class I adenylate-forming enzyme family protein [Lunatimonas sp.]|nr:class I adenylate-forming enzyme family protein [Lunatimonas sp.]